MRSVSIIMARLFLTVSFGFLILQTQAQLNSPFTRYGIGEYYTNQHVISRSMGGLAATYSDGYNNNVGQAVNFSNPATYSSLYMVTLDLGFTIDSRTLLSEKPVGKFTANNFLPGYLAVGLPISKAKGIGFAFGLKPISTINYSVESRERIAGDSLQTLYEGSGGLNQVFVGISKRYGSLNIGFNTGYNFGRKVTNTKKLFLNDTLSYFQGLYGTTTTFGGGFLTAGLQYELKLKSKLNPSVNSTENYYLRFGATGTLKQTLTAYQDQTRETFALGSNGDIKVDSVLGYTKLKGQIILPSTYAIGATLHKTITNTRGVFELWSLGLEYTATKWSNYRFYGQPDQLSNSWQYKLGLQISPDPSAGQSYWSSVNYRAGFFLGKDYINADGNGLKQFGISLGGGFPIRKWRSYDNQFTVINAALQWGKRGSSVNNITENFLQFSMGFSLSDLWFVKRRYD